MQTERVTTSLHHRQGVRNDVELRVVAVFGANGAGDDELAAAELLGAAVNSAQAVLLAGGDVFASRLPNVKDAAIFGAEAAASADRPAAWIGVANQDKATKAQPRGPRSVLVTPGWNHRRNFVGACLCDAAIAIGGTSEGTCSEALFSLYLGRPLIVLGDLPDAERSTRGLKSRAQRRISYPVQQVLAVDQGIQRAYLWAEETAVSLDVRSLPGDDVSASALVTELLGRVTRSSRPPDFDGLVDESDWDRYVAEALADAGRLAGL